MNLEDIKWNAAKNISYAHLTRRTWFGYRRYIATIGRFHSDDHYTILAKGWEEWGGLDKFEAQCVVFHLMSRPGFFGRLWQRLKP